MIGFYSVRKLVEAKKLTDRVANLLIPVSSYPPKHHAVTRLNWHKIDGLYDLDGETPTSLGLLQLCNQLIHSYVFVPDLSPNAGLSGIFFASDRARTERLFFIKSSEVISLFELVASDSPHRASWTYNASSHDFDVSKE